MEKLFKLKEWLSLPDAAQHLSILFGEDVKEADVLRLALDKQLKLSVRFVNGTYATRGERVSLGEIKEIMPSLFSNGDEDNKAFLTFGPDNEIWRFPNNPQTIFDVWDLPLIGAEKLDIEHAYQTLTDGPPVTLSNLEGTLIDAQDGMRFQLQQSWDENEFQRGSEAALEKLEERILRENIGAPEAKKLLDSHKENRKVFLEKQRQNRDSGKNSENYFPAGGLPSDSVLVVRTSALQELEARISEPDKRIEKPIKKRERDTLLTIIGALAELAQIDISQPSKAALPIESQTQRMGARVAARTIENHLKRVSEAMEDRSQS